MDRSPTVPAVYRARLPAATTSPPHGRTARSTSSFCVRRSSASMLAGALHRDDGEHLQQVALDHVDEGSALS